jgi:nitrite reductase/ring-hydroxylating ferredoxin subunit
MTGEHDGEPKVACPMHKRTFSLTTGECMSGDAGAIQTFAVRVDEDGRVWLAAPSAEVLARERTCARHPERTGPA